LPIGFNRRAQETGRIGEHAVAGKNGVDQQSCRANSVSLHVVQRLADAASKDFTGVATGRSWCRHQPDVALRCERKPKRGRHLGERNGDAVIGGFRHDEAGPAGAGFRHAQREVVGFAAGAGEHDVADLGRKRCQQLFSVIEHGLVQITRVGVEYAGLLRDRSNDMGVTVADGSHIIVGVQIAVSGGIVEPHAFAPHKLHRLLVEETIGRSEQAISARDDVLRRDNSVVR
jgi:hypothetical protein